MQIVAKQSSLGGGGGNAGSGGGRGAFGLFTGGKTFFVLPDAAS